MGLLRGAAVASRKDWGLDDPSELVDLRGMSIEVLRETGGLMPTWPSGSRDGLERYANGKFLA